MKKTGFSLVELLLVLGLIAILSSLSFPVYCSFYKNLCLAHAAHQVAADLRAQQQRAFTCQEEIRVVFSGRQYSITGLRAVVLPSGISVTRDEIISFSSTGAPSPGGSGTITLSGKNLSVKKVVVASSGRIRIE